MKNKIIASVIVGAMIVGGGAFYAGTKYRGANRSPGGSFANQMRNNQSGSGMRGVQGQGGMTIGEIIGKDDKSITVKLSNGGSKIVFFTSKTNVIKSVSGSVTDLVLNEQVVVNGSANSDGSIDAQTIQLGSGMPLFRATRAPSSN